jgi:MFS transporter, PAT family, beta-lactamase induction signal transducer AmpG
VRDPALGQAVAVRATGVWKAFRDSLRGFLRELRVGFFGSGPGPVVAVAFALLPMGAMALSSSIATTMQVDLGMTDGQIAQLNVFTTALSGLGCVVGGWLADRFGQLRMLALWYLATTLPTLYLATALAMAGGLQGISIAQFVGASLVFSFCMGLQYGTSAAIFMGLTNPLVAATQFTGYMALKNLAISYTNAWQGAVADAQGFAVVLFIDASLVLLPVLLIPFLRPAARAGAGPSRGAPLPEAG